MKSVQLTINPPLIDYEGHLTLKGTPNYKKFCGKCGFEVISNTAQLKRHGVRQHADENIKFLAYGTVPLKARYKNYVEWMANP